MHSVHDNKLIVGSITMAFGPFVRILARIGMVAGGAIGRAVLEAYKEAAAGRGAAAAAAQKIARRRMSLDEAKKVLDADGVTSRSKIEERFQTLHSLNAPSEECPGSPYLQDRIAAAHKVVLENLETSNPSGQKAKPPEE
eukprot:s2768_g8.t1